VATADLQLPADLTSAYRLHAGACGAGHLFLEHAVSLGDTTRRLWRSHAEAAARLTSMAIAKRLRQQHPAFAEARVAATSIALALPPLRRIRGAAHLPVALSPGDCAGWPARCFVTESGIWVASPTANIDDRAAEALAADPAALAALGQRIGELAAGCRLSPACPPARRRLPLLQRAADVLVVGGGTSGAVAAAAAAEEGAAVLVIDMNHALGGTSTVGGVNSYWYGRRCGYNARVQAWVAAEQEWMGISGPQWNREAKMVALYRNVRNSGAEVLLDAILVDVRTEEGPAKNAIVEEEEASADNAASAPNPRVRVTGAVVATADELVLIKAPVTVDATGDGDAAVCAGAQYAYGSDREGFTMWYSLAPMAEPGVTLNNFTSTVDVGDAWDYTRAILAARRRYAGYDHAAYLAPRESRHILGEVRLTHTDQLRMRRWPDVVNIAYSNHDIKGPSSSNWVRIGLIPPNLEVEIPYRALLPRGIDGLLLAGKAISATHDALPAIRMQADLENLGGVCGVAAAYCALHGIRPRAMPIRHLQQTLVARGVLPPSVLERELVSDGLSSDDLRRLVDMLDEVQELYRYSDMDFGTVRTAPIPFVLACTAGADMLPLLRAAVQTPDARRRLLAAKALAWYGDKAATPVLLEAIDRQLQGDELPARTARIRHVNLSAPDQGAMPDLAYLLHTLALLRDERAIPVLMQVVERLKPSYEQLRDGRSGLYHYVDAVCDIAERLGHPGCLPALRRLHDDPFFRGHTTTSPCQPDHLLERLAYLELVINRALARCGEKEGARVLIDYLTDSRRFLARHAHSELMDISGCRYGPEPAPWLNWYARLAALSPRPWLGGHEWQRQELAAGKTDGLADNEV
jgi:hypothetical protein